MNQQEKITAYLLNRMTPEEASSFRLEIENDPELMAEVKATKLLMIAKELRYREGLKEQMKEWQKTDGPVPDPEPGFFRKNRWMIAIGLLIILLVMVVSSLRYWIPSVPAPVIPTVPVATNENKDSIQIADETTPDDQKQSFPALAFSKKEKLSKFAYALGSLKVKKETQPERTMGSNPKTVTSASNQLRRGFLWTYNQKVYVITNASMVKKVTFEKGEVEWQTPAGDILKLTLKGRDELFDVAVLEVEKKSGWKPITATLANSPVKTGAKIYIFDPVQHADSISISEGTVKRTSKHFFSAISNSIWKTANGPIFNESGQVIGLITAFDDLPKPTYSPAARQAINSDLLYEIALKLIRSGNQPFAFIGARFETNNMGSITISDILSNSPAATEVSLSGALIQSINGTPTSRLSDVAYAFLNVGAGSSIPIVFVQNGLQQVVNIQPKAIKNVDFQNIAEREIKEIRGFQKNFGVGPPALIRKQGDQATEHLIVFYYQSNRKEPAPSWFPVYNVSDLGQGFQIMGLSGGGALKIGTDPDKSEIIPINYENPYLWH